MKVTANYTTPPSEMITISRLKTLLEKDGSSYTADEILLIRDFLYMLANYEFAAYLKEKRRDLEFEQIENNNSQLDEAA